MHAHRMMASCSGAAALHQQPVYHTYRPVTAASSQRFALRSGLLAPARRCRCRGVYTVQASAQNDIRQQISAFVQSDIYSRYLQGAVFVGVLAAVDAAYSGDWVRIHAIKPETEAWLKQTLPLLGGFHIFCAAVSGITANRAGRPWQWPTTKAALVGGLAMFEQLLQVDE